MPDAVIVAACRTPIGKFLGALSQVPAPELGAIAVREAVRRCAIPPEEVDEAILGNILSAGLGQAPARQAALKGGLAPEVAALTVNKMCGSGLKAVMLAAQAIRLGDAETVVAGGMESMSRAPYVLPGGRAGWKYGHQQAIDSMIHDGLWCAFENCHMGSEADYIARKYEITREDQDRYALESHRRAVAAREARAFEEEVVPVTGERLQATGYGLQGQSGERRAEGRRPSAEGKGQRAGSTPMSRSSTLHAPPSTLPLSDKILLQQDEGPRADTALEKLAGLKPAFEPPGTVTAGNASMLSDGAAAVVVTSRERAAKIDSPIKARIVAYATSGVEPKEIFVAPVFAVEKVLAKAGMKAADIDLFEINEAFAAQMLACLRLLKLDAERVNVHGGAIALGHPIGASGARVLATLLNALQRRGLRRGLASLCLGGGNAVAMIVERE